MPRLAPLLLAPALALVALPFLAALGLAAATSLGMAPLAGDFDPDLDAWRRAFAEPGLTESLRLTLLVALATTVLSVIGGTAIALALHRWARGPVTLLVQSAVAVPHVVAAVGMAALLAQSGFLARIGHALGLIDRPADMPVLTADPYGIGIALALLWKEVPFVALVVLSVLASHGEGPVSAARTLGATRLQAFRLVTLPTLAPAALGAGALVFAYALGSWEVPAVLGASHPRLLPVFAADLFLSADIADRPAAVALGLTLAVAAGAGLAGVLLAARAVKALR